MALSKTANSLCCDGSIDVKSRQIKGENPYLNKEVTADYYVEHTYDKDFNYNCVQTAESIMAAVEDFNAAHDAEKQILTDMMQKRCETFSTALTYHMDRKKITVDDLVERAGLSDTTIKNYRAGKVQQPPIENTRQLIQKIVVRGEDRFEIIYE